MSWLKRNLRPIAWVLLASAAVIVAFEILDALGGGGQPADVAAEEAVGLNVGGLIKVTLFLGVGFGITKLVLRRRGGSASDS